MSRSTSGILLVLGLLAAAALVFWVLAGSGGGDTGLDLEADGRAAVAPPAAPPTPVQSAGDPAPSAPRVSVLPRDGVPRVLPPDAAIEDVRDALALADAAQRARDVQAAYEAVARVAADPDVIRELQRYVGRVEDPVARGIVLAALGANRHAGNIDWLAQQLLSGKTEEDRLGALLGLAWDEYEEGSELTSTSALLAGIEFPVAPLPELPVALKGTADWLDRAGEKAATDALDVIATSVEHSVEYAALLVVEGKRVCRVYAGLGQGQRATLRAAALAHAALPGSVRRVLETTSD